MAVLTRLRGSRPKRARHLAARRVLEICEGNGIRDWDLAYAFEALARASRVAGDEDAEQDANEPSRRTEHGLIDFGAAST